MSEPGPLPSAGALGVPFSGDGGDPCLTGSCLPFTGVWCVPRNGLEHGPGGDAGAAEPDAVRAADHLRGGGPEGVARRPRQGGLQGAPPRSPPPRSRHMPLHFKQTGNVLVSSWYLSLCWGPEDLPLGWDPQAESLLPENADLGVSDDECVTCRPCPLVWERGRGPPPFLDELDSVPGAGSRAHARGGRAPPARAAFPGRTPALWFGALLGSPMALPTRWPWGRGDVA